MSDDDKHEMVGVQIGTAVSTDEKADIFVALKVRSCEIYISPDDARDIAKSMIECAGYVDGLNKERTVQ